MQLEEIEIPAPVLPASGSAITNVAIPDGWFARLVDVRSSFATDASVQNRVVSLYVDYRGHAVMLPAAPVIPASSVVQVFFSEAGQSVLAASLSSPGHTNGGVFRGLMQKFLRVQVVLNNPGIADQLGLTRVRYLIGKLDEFEL